MSKMNEIMVDPENKQVTFGAGVTYSMLIEALKEKKMSLKNLPSLPHINVVGSVVTGTHGSGIDNKAMASHVSSISIVDPEG